MEVQGRDDRAALEFVEVGGESAGAGVAGEADGSELRFGLADLGVPGGVEKVHYINGYHLIS